MSVPINTSPLRNLDELQGHVFERAGAVHRLPDPELLTVEHQNLARKPFKISAPALRDTQVLLLSAVAGCAFNNLQVTIYRRVLKSIDLAAGPTNLNIINSRG